MTTTAARFMRRPGILLHILHETWSRPRASQLVTLPRIRPWSQCGTEKGDEGGQIEKEPSSSSHRRPPGWLRGAREPKRQRRCRSFVGWPTSHAPAHPPVAVTGGDEFFVLSAFQMRAAAKTLLNARLTDRVSNFQCSPTTREESGSRAAGVRGRSSSNKHSRWRDADAAERSCRTLLFERSVGGGGVAAKSCG